jgi:hypothetical protein
MVVKEIGDGCNIGGVNVAFPGRLKQLLKMAVLVGCIGQGGDGGEGIVKDDMKLR